MVTGMSLINPFHTCFPYAGALLLIAMLSVAPPSAGADPAERQFTAVSRLLGKADEALETGNDPEALRLYGATIAAYREFARQFPDTSPELVQFRIAYCRNQLMNLLAVKNARETASPEAAATPLDPGTAAQVQHAITLCRQGTFADAATVMRALLEKTPDLAPALLVLATALLGQNDFAGARPAVERAVALDPTSPAAHYNLSQLIVRDPEPDFDKARTHYNTARRLGSPADTDLESILGL